MNTLDVLPYAAIILPPFIFLWIVLVSVVDTRKNLLFGESLQKILQITYNDETKSVQVTEQEQGALNRAIQEYLTERRLKKLEFRIFSEVQQGYDIHDGKNSSFPKELLLIYPDRNSEKDHVLAVRDVLQDELHIHPAIYQTVSPTSVSYLPFLKESLTERHKDFHNMFVKADSVGYIIRYTIQLVDTTAPYTKPLFEMHSAWRHTDINTEPIQMQKPTTGSYAPDISMSLNWNDSPDLALFNEVRETTRKAKAQRAAKKDRTTEERATAATTGDTSPLSLTAEPMGTPPKSFPFFKKRTKSKK